MSLRRMIPIVLSMAAVLVLAAPAAVAQTTWYVDDVTDPNEDGSAAHPFDTIQEGIDAAVDSDTVEVADGTYTGTGNRNLDFLGKAITVHSASGSASCTIDCESSARGVYFHQSEGAAAVLDGFTITNATGSAYGGAILCYGSSPTISNCVITNGTPSGTPGSGGGIGCYQGDPTITNCTITGCTAANAGGGIYCYSADPTITGCTITGNHANYNYGGGGIALYGSSPTIANCIIAENTTAAPGWGGGVLIYGDSSPAIVNCLISDNQGTNGGGGIAMYGSFSGAPTFTNCTIAGNTADVGYGLYVNDGGTPLATNCILWDDSSSEIVGTDITVIYCDVMDDDPDDATVYAGTANIDDDPLFADPNAADYHLGSGSPCTDAGDDSAVPAWATTDLDDNPRIGCAAVDLGAYESSFGGIELVCPADESVECLAGVPDADFAGGSASDSCGGDPTVTHEGDTDNGGTGCAGDPLIIARTYRATRAADDFEECTQTITVVDATAPVLAVPADITVECDASTAPSDTGEATATDNCDAAPVVEFSDSVADGACAQESTITRTWTATDTCGNSASADQVITVVDTTAPVLTVDTTPIIVTDADCSGAEAVTLPAATATDNCDTSVAITNDAPTELPAGETTTVTFTATDACGNTDTAQVDVTVEYGATIRVIARKFTVGFGTRPCVGRAPLDGITVAAFEYSAGSCAWEQLSNNWWILCWALPDIFANCTPVTTAVTNEYGLAYLDVPPGNYVVASHFDADGDGELDMYLGRYTCCLQCGEMETERLFMLHLACGRRTCGKWHRRTGSELIMVEPDEVVWDGEEQSYPFVFDSEGDWDVTVSVEPPEGFVSDYDELSEEVDNDLEAVQFSITEVGSDLVPTQTRFEVLHHGQRHVIKSEIGIRLTPDYARQRGFDVEQLRARGLIKEQAPQKQTPHKQASQKQTTQKASLRVEEP